MHLSTQCIFMTSHANHPNDATIPSSKLRNKTLQKHLWLIVATNAKVVAIDTIIAFTNWSIPTHLKKSLAIGHTYTLSLFPLSSLMIHCLLPHCSHHNNSNTPAQLPPLLHRNYGGSQSMLGASWSGPHGSACTFMSFGQMKGYTTPFLGLGDDDSMGEQF